MKKGRALVWAGAGLAAVAAIAAASQISHQGFEAVPASEPSDVMVIAGEDQNLDREALDNAKTVKDLESVEGLEMGGSDSDDQPAPSEAPR